MKRSNVGKSRIGLKPKEKSNSRKNQKELSVSDIQTWASNLNIPFNLVIVSYFLTWFIEMVLEMYLDSIGFALTGILEGSLAFEYQQKYENTHWFNLYKLIGMKGINHNQRNMAWLCISVTMFFFKKCYNQCFQKVAKIGQCQCPCQENIEDGLNSKVSNRDEEKLIEFNSNSGDNLASGTLLNFEKETSTKEVNKSLSNATSHE